MPWSSVISLSTLYILALAHCGACHAHEVSCEKQSEDHFGHCRPGGVEHLSVLSDVSADGFGIGGDGGSMIPQMDKLTNSKVPLIRLLMNSCADFPFPYNFSNCSSVTSSLGTTTPHDVYCSKK